MKTWTKGRTVFLVVWLVLIAGLVAAVFAVGLSDGGHEDIREVMKDGVLHEKNKVSFFGLEVNPAVISAYVVTAVLLIAALVVRIFVVPRFKTVPGGFQSVLEKAVGFFTDMAGKNSPARPGFVGAYIFCAGFYIFFGTLFELFGVQVTATNGKPVALPAPLADINGAIAMGFLSFFVILAAGLFVNGPKGALRVLKDFSLPVSMSFRLFGALLSGLLVTELVYHYVALSFVLPVVVGVMFTLLHALIQAYVLSILVSIFYGEAVEPREKKRKRIKGPGADVPHETETETEENRG